MNEAVFDVGDIRKVRRQLADQYRSMPAIEADKLQAARVEAVLAEILRYRQIAKSLDLGLQP